MSLKSKVVGGATWNLVGKMADYVFRFTIGVVIARLLSPAEYGIVGLANIFITLSYIFVDSGFTYALIQKQDCNERKSPFKQRVTWTVENIMNNEKHRLQ